MLGLHLHFTGNFGLKIAEMAEFRSSCHGLTKMETRVAEPLKLCRSSLKVGESMEFAEIP